MAKPNNKKDVNQGTSLMSGKDIGMSREAEAALTKSAVPFQFLTLLQGGSDIVMKRTLKGAAGGMYVLGKQKLLGDEFLAVPSISRPRAMIFEDGQVTLETFDPSSEAWGKCKAQKKGGNTGIEFLLWIPDEECFATFYFKNTAKSVGAKVVEAREARQLACFTSTMIEGKENSWYVPVVEGVDADGPVVMPTEEQQQEALLAFESYKQETKAPEPKRAR